METAVAQVNVRMNRSLKEAGDAALAELGLSPSDVVRKLWEKLSKRGEVALRTAAMLSGDDGSRELNDETAQLLAATERLTSGFDKFGATWGLNVDSLNASIVDTDAFDEVRYRHLGGSEGMYV